MSEERARTGVKWERLDPTNLSDKLQATITQYKEAYANTVVLGAEAKAKLDLAYPHLVFSVINGEALVADRKLNPNQSRVRRIDQ
jgi:hypothetical protein